MNRVLELLQQILEAVRQQTGKPVMNIREVAKYLGVSKSLIYELKALYKIPFTEIGGRLVFVKTAIDQWLANRTVYSSEEHRNLLDGRHKTKFHVVGQGKP